MKYEVRDTIQTAVRREPGQLISRHRTLAAAQRVIERANAQAKRRLGPTGYTTLDIFTPDLTHYCEECGAPLDEKTVTRLCDDCCKSAHEK